MHAPSNGSVELYPNSRLVGPLKMTIKCSFFVRAYVKNDKINIMKKFTLLTLLLFMSSCNTEVKTEEYESEFSSFFKNGDVMTLSLIHISEPTRPY